DLPLHRDRESPGGQRHGGRPHRPPPGGPEEDGGGGGRPERGDPLVRAGAVPRLYLCGVPTGDRAHPPDPGPHGAHRPPHSGGHGVRGEKARAGPPGAVPSCGGAAVSPSPDRGAGGAVV
ncbi:TnpV protein, partial [Dysosmobacter welbionis]